MSRSAPLVRRTALAAWLLAAPFATGQTPPSGLSDRESLPNGPRSFTPGYFASFNPVTAEDMVRRIPGFTLENGDERRGFAGAAGNVLINGETPSSKTPISEQLARISASDILRIDLYSGGGDAAEVRGRTLVVDVRLRPRDTAPTNTFVAQVNRLDPSGSLNPVLSATRAFQSGGGALSFTLQAQPSRRGRIEFDRRLYSASGALLERSDELLQGSYAEYKASGRAGWRPSARDAVNLNADLTVSPTDDRHTFSETHAPTGGLLRVEDSLVEGGDNWQGQIGGDWEHRFSESTSLKLLALTTRKETSSEERYTTTPVAAARRDTLILRSSISEEWVARSVATFRASAGSTFDLAIEGAFNGLSSELDVSLRTGGQVIDRTPPVADTRVEEQRIEASLAHAWRPSPRLRLESGVTLEASRISQSGDAVQERDFTYLKPNLTAVFSPSDGWRATALIEREVAQLDFSEFASAVSLFDGVTNVGNPNLEPEKTWRVQAELERRFGAKGVVSAAVFHDRVEDVQDQIPIARRFDGPGNLGDGVRFGGRVDANLPLDSLGLKSGEMRLRAALQDSRVDDPTSGGERPFSDEAEWSWSVDLRQPWEEKKLLFGALLEHKDGTRQFRLAEERLTEFQDGRLDLFLETTHYRGIVIRLTLSHAFQPTELRRRLFFTPDRSDPSNLSSIEERLAKGGFGTRSNGLRIAGRF